LLLDQNIELLNQRIAGLQTRDSLNEKIINSYVSEIAVMKEQRAVFENQLKENEKTIRKLNRKVRWVSIAGIAGMGALTFLYLTK
jgi:septal ring factor EnvC (AmiA/AmiB activator)